MGNLEFIDGLGPQSIPPDGMLEVYDRNQARWIIVPEDDAWQYSTDVMQYAPQLTIHEGEQ